MRQATVASANGKQRPSVPSAAFTVGPGAGRALARGGGDSPRCREGAAMPSCSPPVLRCRRAHLPCSRTRVDGCCDEWKSGDMCTHTQQPVSSLSEDATRAVAAHPVVCLSFFCPRVTNPNLSRPAPLAISGNFPRGGHCAISGNLPRGATVRSRAISHAGATVRSRAVAGTPRGPQCAGALWCRTTQTCP